MAHVSTCECQAAPKLPWWHPLCFLPTHFSSLCNLVWYCSSNNATFYFLNQNPGTCLLCFNSRNALCIWHHQFFLESLPSFPHFCHWLSWCTLVPPFFVPFLCYMDFLFSPLSGTPQFLPFSWSLLVNAPCTEFFMLFYLQCLSSSGWYCYLPIHRCWRTDP